MAIQHFIVGVSVMLWGLAASAGYADTPPLKHIRGEAVQGGLLIYQTSPDAQIFIDGEQRAVSANGFFPIAFHRDDEATVTLELRLAGQPPLVEKITPRRRSYEIERIDGLARQMVTPDKEVMSRITADREDVYLARHQHSDSEDALISGFSWPATGRITGIYGAQRILNGKPRQPHYGIDIALPTGAAIAASADGIVTMAQDLYFTGGTIIIDHGFGLSTTYSHLEQMIVRPSQQVKRGQIIGTAGSTGRSTGPHLDWRVNLGNQRLDPALISAAPDIPGPKPRPSLF